MLIGKVMLGGDHRGFLAICFSYTRDAQRCRLLFGIRHRLEIGFEGSDLRV